MLRMILLELLSMSGEYDNLMFYGAILVFKVSIMSLLTSKTRHKNGKLRSPEDGQYRLGTTDVRYRTV